MVNSLRIFLIVAPLLFISVQSGAQNRLDSNQTIQLALDIYNGINRGTLPASIALKTKQLIEAHTYRCIRVSEYQVYFRRPNLMTVKVKCSGDSTYGLTVGSNGYFSVYGGDGIVSPINLGDAVVYSFAAEGDLTESNIFDLQQITEEAVARFASGGEFDYLYFVATFLVIGAVFAAMIFVWVRQWRQRQGRKPRQRMKPMQKFTIGLSGAVKDQLLLESTKVAKYVHYHTSGLYIAVGKRGKRRLFFSLFWARIYARFNFHHFEAAESKVARLALGEVEQRAAENKKA